MKLRKESRGNRYIGMNSIKLTEESNVQEVNHRLTSDLGDSLTLGLIEVSIVLFSPIPLVAATEVLPDFVFVADTVASDSKRVF